MESDKKINRRDFLGGLLASGVGAWMGGCKAASISGMSSSGDADRPNMVLIVTDDQCWNMLGYRDRYPFLETPNTDRLAEEGARCNNAFATTSLCMPSRATIMTGVLPYKHGVKTNSGSKQEGTQLPDRTPVFPQLLQQAGYETALVGKWHIDKQDSSPKPGFDHWVSFVGQGAFFDPELNVNGEMVKASGHMTDVLTEYAVDFINRPHDKPFCLILTHKAPHGDTTWGPFTPPERHKGYYEDVQISPPANYFDDLADKPEWVRRYVRAEQLTPGRQAMKADMDKVPADEVPDRVSPEPWDPHPDPLVDQLRCVPALDESLGTIMDQLEAQGILDDTFMMYTSDHGTSWFNHGIVNKRVMYEESLRIPMLIRYPKMIEPGQKVDDMALTTDIAPTALNLAGIQTPSHIQGRSLVPVLRGDNYSWRDAFMAEYHWMGPHPHFPTMYAARTDRWKYIRSDVDDGPAEELYDLKNDPSELSNLAGYPGSQGELKKMRQTLEKLKNR